MLAGYDHLLAAAARLQWDAEAVDLGADAVAVRRLGGEPLARLTTLVAGFRLAEHAVADELGPWVAGARGRAAACFAAQARDETRHARFFDRISCEVLGSDGEPPPAIRRLFGSDLPAAARALAADAARMPEAVGLYHLVLEGIAFAVGQDALHELAVAHGLRGIAEGVARVQGDERWHVGLGVLHLQRLGAPMPEIDDRVQRAIAAWGPRVATPQRTGRVLAAHRRRCAIAAQRAVPAQ